MKLYLNRFHCSIIAFAFGIGTWQAPAATTNWTVIGWNNLGMHCMDSEYSVFSILPPYTPLMPKSWVPQPQPFGS